MSFPNKTIKQWAANSVGSPNNVIGQPGSLAAGAEVYSSDTDIIQANAAWAAGLAAALINAPGGLASPVLQEINGFFYTASSIIAYIQQAGVCEWKTDRTYRVGSLALGVDPTSGIGNGILYQSKTDPNSGNDPRTDTTNWQTFASAIAGSVAAPGQLLHAWINFNGSVNPIVINDSRGIMSVTENAIGDYVFYFTTVFPNTNYGWTASETQVDTTGPLDQMTRLSTDIKTNGSLQLKVLNGGNSGVTSSPDVSVNIFGNA